MGKTYHRINKSDRRKNPRRIYGEKTPQEIATEKELQRYEREYEDEENEKPFFFFEEN